MYDVFLLNQDTAKQDSLKKTAALNYLKMLILVFLTCKLSTLYEQSGKTDSVGLCGTG